MAVVSKRIMNMLSEFFVCELGGKAIDGITYALVHQENKDKTDRYMEIRKELNKDGFDTSDVFRVYKVSNGYVFDMDIAVSKVISKAIAKAVDKQLMTDEVASAIIEDSPVKRRTNDMIRLAKLVKSEYDKGNTDVEVALFNTDSSKTIMITGKLKGIKPVTVRYAAFGVRHWDIEEINSKLLMKNGIRICKLETKEILPQEKGVSFIVYTEGVQAV